MKISSRVRYAVMALVDLSLLERFKDSPVSLSSISERQGLSLLYLEQLFLKLKKAGLVASVRGSNGGYSLAKPADEIRIFDVFEAVERSFKATRCHGIEGGCQKKNERCQTHDFWVQLSDHVQSFLKEKTIENICLNRTQDTKVYACAQENSGIDKLYA